MKIFFKKYSKKLSVFFLVIVIFFAAFYTVNRKVQSPPEEAITKAFNSSGAKIAANEVYLRAEFKGLHKTQTSVDKIADSILESIGGNTIFFDNDSSPNSGKIACLAEGHLGEAIKISFQNDKINEDYDENYITFSISGRPVSDLSSMGSVVSGILEEQGYTVNESMCVTGNYEGRLDTEKISETFKNVLRSVNATEVERLEDRGLISISAYTPQIENFIKVNGRKVNLALALRYNSYEDKTFIWLATPVIYSEY